MKYPHVKKIIFKIKGLHFQTSSNWWHFLFCIAVYLLQNYSQDAQRRIYRNVDYTNKILKKRTHETVL